MNVKDKNMIVTGGGNGVGRELVLTLLSKGATVFAVDINIDALNETVRISGKNKRLYVYVVDISKKEAVASFAEEIMKEHGKVDGIINNAGIIQPFVKLNDLEFDRIDRVMNVNFYGTLYMIKVFLPHLLKRPEAHIVNISSMGGFLPVPGQSIYGASKAAVKLLSEGLYSELLNTNVKVTVVVPGGMATDIKKNSDLTDSKVNPENHNSKLILSPNKAANLIINAMEKNRFSVCIGKDCNTMNFLYRISPVFATKMINRLLGSKTH